MYCSEDLGGFYLDILKDRLYTSGTTSKARRSAQTAIWHITHALLRVMAPMLSFTAEEAWAVFAGKDTYTASDETIFTQVYYKLPEVADAPALLARFAALREIRAAVTKQLEEVRIAGGIGSSLQAEIEIKASGDKYALLNSLGDDLKFIFITSQATVTQVASEAEEAVIVTPSPHQKCERCWHYRADVGTHADHPGICGRCVSNLFGKGEARKFA
jgi:isoleucyl-tRNA synthetase